MLHYLPLMASSAADIKNFNTMKLSQLQAALGTMEGVTFKLPDGTEVPAHFHVTEVGAVTKHYIDCGGTLRQDVSISMQLWQASDYDHRLQASKLSNILELAKSTLQLPDAEVEVEYQGASTIERYALTTTKDGLQLLPIETACLALDACGVGDKVKVNLAGAVATATNYCSPDGGCC